MAHSYLERELKFEVPQRFQVPDLVALLPDGGRIESSVEQLHSAYYDTADHALLRARMTLRQRTGSTDTGWQLKVPHELAREEISVPLGSDSVPDELRSLLAGVTRDQPLHQIATVTMERTVTRLVDADGQRLIEVDDDQVAATASGDGVTISSWREVEVELGSGDEALLATLAKRLRKAGATPSSAKSKLSRALALPEPAERAGQAGDVLHEYLLAQQRAMLAGDLALRRGDEAAIHRTRVATRRLRSTLRTFGLLFDADSASALDAELRWYAGVLGEVRDRQVLTERLADLVDELPDELVLGPVRARISTTLDTELRENWQHLQGELSGERYRALLSTVAGWLTEPPVTDRWQRPAKSLDRYLDRAERKVTRRLAGAVTGDELHAARKAAKRARYAAEIVGSKSDIRRFTQLQDLLGGHQDSLLAAELLRRLGAAAAGNPAENGFTFGLLYEREQARAARSRRDARRAASRF